LSPGGILGRSPSASRRAAIRDRRPAPPEWIVAGGSRRSGNRPQLVVEHKDTAAEGLAALPVIPGCSCCRRGWAS
jgi:hypothetical protein